MGWEEALKYGSQIARCAKDGISNTSIHVYLALVYDITYGLGGKGNAPRAFRARANPF